MYKLYLLFLCVTVTAAQGIHPPESRVREVASLFPPRIARLLDVKANPRFNPNKIPQSTPRSLADPSQLWVSYYSAGTVPSDDEAMDIAFDPNGNVYVTGSSTRSLSGTDFLTIKYDSNGTVLWTARYDNGWDDVGMAISVDAGGNVYVTGASRGTTLSLDCATIKYTASGTQQWVARYNGSASGDDWGADIAVDVSGAVFVTGPSEGVGNLWDYLTLKYNASGTQQWASRYDGPAATDDVVAALALDGAGGVYITGNSVGLSGMADYATVRYNSSGAQQWVSRYDGPVFGEDAATAIAVDASFSVYVTGGSESANNGFDYVTIKYSATGVQQWVSRYNNGSANGDDKATAISVDASGRAVVTGESFGVSGSFDFATVAYNATGGQRWAVRYNGTDNGDDKGIALSVDAGSNVYVTGWSESATSNLDFVTIKYNSSGVVQWNQRKNGSGNGADIVRAIAVESGGVVYVAGSMVGIGSSLDYATVKYSTVGVERWDRMYNGPGSSEDIATAVATDPFGNVYVTGMSRALDNSFDFATVKYDTLGRQQWVASYSGVAVGDDIPTAIAVDGGGNVFVTGASQASDGSFDYVTIRYGPSGNQQWLARYNGPAAAHDIPVSIALDPSGNVVVTGASKGTNLTFDCATLKYSASGVLQWALRYEGADAGDDRGSALAIDATGNIFVCGSSVGVGTGDDYATIKYTANGVQTWVARYDGPVSGEDNAVAIALDDSGNVYVTGKSLGSGNLSDFATIRYNPSGIQDWIVRYNGPANEDDEAAAIAWDGMSGIYVTGSSTGLGMSKDIATIRYDRSGTPFWATRYATPQNADEIPVTLAINEIGEPIIAGFTTDDISFLDFLVLKYSGRGVQRWAIQYDGPGSALDAAIGGVVSTRGRIYVAGSSRRDAASVYSTVCYRETDPLFVPSRRVLSFGEVLLSCRLRDSIIVKNPRSSPLSITAVNTASLHYLVSHSSATVAAFDSVKFYVTFAPTALGLREAALVFSNTGETSPDTIRLSGIGRAAPGSIAITPGYGVGWQLVSLPVRPPCEFFVHPSISLFDFMSGVGYVRRDQFANRKGYWIKLSAPEIAYAGDPIFRDTIDVALGWNLMGSISTSVDTSAIVSIPPGIRTTHYYGYAGGYTASQVIEPGRAYWVKVNSPGRFILQTGGEAGRSEKRDDPLIGFSRLDITDARGGSQTLYLGLGSEHSIDLAQYELPPRGPEGVFDARFSAIGGSASGGESGRMADMLASNGETAIVIRSTSYPVSVAWNLPAEQRLVLRDGHGGEIIAPRQISGVGEMTITNPAVTRIVICTNATMLPTTYGLEQNYPNPLNPSTMIKYQLPIDNWVILKVYDVLGREVATLVNEPKRAGTYRVAWDASAYPSGVYYYRLIAGSFSEVRRMVFLK